MPCVFWTVPIFVLHLTHGIDTLHERFLELTVMKRFSTILIMVFLAGALSAVAQDLPDDVVYSDLMLAARDGDTKKAEALIRGGSDVNLRTQPYGFTALIIASMWGNEGVARQLLDRNAQVNAKDDQGNTALIYASQFGHIGVIEMLLGKGALINETSTDGKSALYNACILGYDDIVEALIAAKADVNKPTKTGDTPLIAAASWGHSDIVKRLVDAGANKSLRNQRGKTALDLAREKGYPQVVAVLQ